LWSGTNDPINDIVYNVVGKQLPKQIEASMKVRDSRPAGYLKLGTVSVQSREKNSTTRVSSWVELALIPFAHSMNEQEAAFVALAAQPRPRHNMP